MTNRIPTSCRSLPLNAEARRALLACGLWMRAAFAGASATAIAVIQLVDGEWSAVPAMTVAVAGIACAVHSYRRSQAALGDAGKPSTASAMPVAAHR